MSDTIAPPDAPSLPPSATLQATVEKIASALARQRADLQAKRDELEDFYATGAATMADRALAGDSITPPKDASKLQQQVDTIFAVVRELEARHQKATAEYRLARESELSAQADAVHAEFGAERLRLLAIVIAASRQYVEHTQRSLPEPHVLFRNSEHHKSITDAQESVALTRLSKLKSEAERIGSSGCVTTVLDHSPFPTADLIAAAHEALANI